MNRLFKPYWPLLTVTIPQLFIFIMFSRIFYLINSELTPKSINYWIGLGIYLAISWCFFTIYAIRGVIKRKDIHPFIGLISFIAYTVFLLVYFIKYTMIIPTSISNWMLLGKRPGITVLTLLMPVLAHSMLIIVEWTNKRFKSNISKDIIFMIAIPGAWYLLLNIFAIGGFRLLQGLEILMPIVLIISLISFFFFFIRIIMTILKKKINVWQKYLGPIALIGSLLGLTLNQSMGNILGDFSHYSFYILAVITGVLMIIPQRDNGQVRLGLFVAKSITLVFSLYFFVVFLPYLPLAFIGIIVFGLGILMLVPIVLMFLHIRSLWFDFDYLKNFYSKKLLLVLFLVGILIIPSTILITIGQDKYNLDKALKYTYQWGYEDKEAPELNTSGIKRALKNIKYGKGLDRDNLGMFNVTTPYLTTFYNWYVLDNFSMSNEKINRLEKLFLGESDAAFNEEVRNPDSQNKDVYISKIKSDTAFDSKEKAFKSWIHLDIQNGTDFQNEFTTSFGLPEGSYVKDYYLFVENEKKYGLIADKRAANWIYQQTKSVRRDPGILTYTDGNKIDFKIFPFQSREIRKTGIEIVHRTPITINIDGNIIDLKTSDSSYKEPTEALDINGAVKYIPRELKDSLTKVSRKPRYYFIMDYSKESKDSIEDYISRIQEYIERNNIKNSIEKIITQNYEEKEFSYNDKLEEKLKDIPVKGGFNLDYSIKRILYENYKGNSNEYPVIVVVTDYIKDGVLSNDFDSLKFIAPEGLDYYLLDRSNKLVKYSLLSSNKKINVKYVDEIEETPVLIWQDNKGKTFYLSDNNEDSIILDNNDLDSVKSLENGDWENGVMLKAMYMSYMLHPEEQLRKSLYIVQNSILRDMMSPLTSFIVLENEAQEKVLLEKQKEILSTDKPVDISDFTEMDEPSLFLLGILVLGFLLFKNHRKNNNKAYRD